MLAIASLFSILLAAQRVSAEDKAPPPKSTLNGLWQADLSESQVLLLRIDNEAIEMKAKVDGHQSLVWEGKLVLSKEHPDSHMDWTHLKSGARTFPDNRILFLEAQTRDPEPRHRYTLVRPLHNAVKAACVNTLATRDDHQQSR